MCDKTATRYIHVFWKAKMLAVLQTLGAVVLALGALDSQPNTSIGPNISVHRNKEAG